MKLTSSFLLSIILLLVLNSCNLSREAFANRKYREGKFRINHSKTNSNKDDADYFISCGAEQIIASDTTKSNTQVAISNNKKLNSDTIIKNNVTQEKSGTNTVTKPSKIKRAIERSTLLNGHYFKSIINKIDNEPGKTTMLIGAPTLALYLLGTLMFLDSGNIQAILFLGLLPASIVAIGMLFGLISIFLSNETKGKKGQTIGAFGFIITLFVGLLPFLILFFGGFLLLIS